MTIIIILLGTHYDMRLLQNAFHVELPMDYFYILNASSNDEFNDNGIPVMADRLVNEIFTFCQTKCKDIIGK